MKVSESPSTPTQLTSATAVMRGDAVPTVVAVTSQELTAPTDELIRARAFAEPLLANETLGTGENILAHADAVAAILRSIGGSQAMQAACYLVYACEHLNKPYEVIAKAFGENFAHLAVETTKLVHVQRVSRAAEKSAQLHDDPKLQTENVRKMLLAFSRDLRVVMLRLASRLQTLRHYAASKRPVPQALARESLSVFAPLANRLGIWQIKWEMEDLAFRFLEPDTYKHIASLLDAKRTQREAGMQQLRLELQAQLVAKGIAATVQGRPKHIYSIVRKMRGKSLDFDRVFDIRALRVVVPDVASCYEALAWVHERFTPVHEEYDDYIAKPKNNGYQSLHTVVRDTAGLPIEIQIRTQAMHDHAESGVAAHWAYKEAGAKGYAGVSANSDYDAKIAVLRQLLAWERDISGSAQQQDKALFDDRIYVLTPDAAIVELPQGATPIDFAYTVHTNLGHRCRGAKIDGAMVPLNTVCKRPNGGDQRHQRRRSFARLAQHRPGLFGQPSGQGQSAGLVQCLDLARERGQGPRSGGKLLQREGKTAMKLDDLASQLGFKSADGLFEVVGKDEYSLRHIETLLNPPEPALTPDEIVLLKKSRGHAPQPPSSVLVVGMDSLLTQLARCCKPAPPDAINGFVTRGKGVSIHRHDCSNFKELVHRDPGRVIEVRWGQHKLGESSVYPVDVAIEAHDRQGLLRDISEVFAKEKMNVIGVQTQSIKGTAWMTFTVEVSDSGLLQRVLMQVSNVRGVDSARRR